MDNKLPARATTTSIDAQSTTPIRTATESQIKGWPQEAHDLAEHQREWSTIIYDTVLVLMPLALLAKTIIVVAFGDFRDNGELDNVSKITVGLVEFNQQLVTLFTIVFGTIIATLVQRYALWKAQIGASVAELEQLHSSVSLPKTISLIWKLRSWTLTSIALTMIWSWLYLGSQAVSREIGFYDGDHASSLRVVYQNASAPSLFEEHTPSGLELAQMNSQFLQSILYPLNKRTWSYQTWDTTGWDQFGNFLIPTSTYVSQVFHKGYWLTGHPDTQTWSSFIGIPLTAMFANGEETGNSGFCYDCWSLTTQILGDFSLNTSYVQANCSEPSLGNGSSFPGTRSFVSTVLNTTNATIPTIQISELWNGTSTISTSCNLTETRVHLVISCKAAGCMTTKQKTTYNLPISSNLFRNQTATNLFLNNMLLSGGNPASNSSADAALLDSPILAGMGFFQSWKYDYIYNFKTDKYGAPVASGMLTMFINSYLQASQQQARNTTRAYMMDVLRGVTQEPGLVDINIKGAVYIPQYRINWAWLALDMAGCVLLLAGAIGAVWLRTRTLAPDIFGYVSSLTRDNPLVDLPKGGSTLDGIERSKMLKHVVVKIADISGQNEVGKVGLTRMDSDHTRGVELTRAKQYV